MALDTSAWDVSHWLSAANDPNGVGSQTVWDTAAHDKQYGGLKWTPGSPMGKLR